MLLEYERQDELGEAQEQRMAKQALSLLVLVWGAVHPDVFNLWHHVLSANLRSLEYRNILAIQKFYFLKRHSSGFFFVSAFLLRQLMMAALFFVIQDLCFLAHLGGDTIASGARYERVWGEIRSHLGRRSLTNIEIDLLGTLHHVSLGVAMSLTRCSGFIPISPWLLARLS